jgi:hypothetical protein
LNSSSLDDLPVIIRFIFQSIHVENVSSVIAQFRLHLNIQSTNIPAATPNQQNGSEPLLLGNTLHASPVLLLLIKTLLESLKSGIRWKKEIANAFLKELQNLESEVRNISQHIIIMNNPSQRRIIRS